MHEWALLIFTIAIPAACGGMLFLWFMNGRPGFSGKNSYESFKLPLLIIASLSLAGLAASFFHLGEPLHALNAVRGFGRSWMSNEIVISGAFIGLACLTAGLAIVRKQVSPALMLITGLVGLAAIYCMATTYTVTRVNGWNHLNTYFVFYGTAIAAGPVLGAALLLPKRQSDSARTVVKWAFALAIAGLGLQAAGAAMFSGFTADLELITGATAAAKLAPYSGLIGARWVIELIGLGLLAYMSMSSGKRKIGGAAVVGAFILFLLAESMGRYVFYVLGS
ncbi:dimethyl sulfoxide reductase anchor subunit family protein [Bacillus sp. B-jedd]|uniref:dimethyl sulfoxide reductase anchor subunit family protein n=1 Tax=Bacillus sp. B-jedd TaxID=1476857 RepID=UPI00051564DA|nr:DmsC/YnfH family molybdoenzyme membrane anchor subunit [Bacillus sp. B-jedd]CEG26545.1 Anaerobic dimethyl sulfoxide reductase chain C [Bacillus sp. B-jedd]